MTDLRSLVLVFGDQLDLDASGFDEFDAKQDLVWMAEVAEESQHVWSSKPRIALFLTAMRHFALALEQRGRRVHYTRLDASLHEATDEALNKASNKSPDSDTLEMRLRSDLLRLKPQQLIMTAPGEWRVLSIVKNLAAELGLPLSIREDRHFFCTVRDFAAHAKRHKSLRMEYFYREQRVLHHILMEPVSGEEEARSTNTGNDRPDVPVGGQWNFDRDNRKAFGPDGPGFLPTPQRFAPDTVTQEVIALVNQRFADHPGKLDSFAWPVTREQALRALQTFIDERLTLFGPYQDAMWPDDPWLYHSQLSAALNLKLLNPREVVTAAEAAYRKGNAPLASVEGFIRQILGWREYVRGVYWTQMPGYRDRNALDAQQNLPAWYWTGDTSMACLRDAITQTLTHGYANHIQRLMITGLYAMMLGVRPQQVHEWYLAVYVDAVEWVELPNTLGMSQYADGGVMGSKPYAASGKYIERMSPHCTQCRFDPALKTGEDACPFTTLYWDFLMKHDATLSKNTRMKWQVANLARLDETEKQAVRARAEWIRQNQV